jgi:hypothetical protein
MGLYRPQVMIDMTAVWAKAAMERKVVIFTCMPKRYGNIGKTAVASLMLAGKLILSCSSKGLFEKGK